MTEDRIVVIINNEFQNTMTRYSIILFFAFAFLNGSAQPHQARNSTAKPNIIYVLADDLGIGNVSSYGADNYKTPNIDQLAKNGIQFKHAYTAPLCGPSRAMILTGRYAFRTGATSQVGASLLNPSKEILIPSVLKEAGYITSAIGKWNQLPLNPSDFGFDDYLKFRGSGVYWNKEKKVEQYTVNGKNILLKDNEYMPDIMHDHLVNFISRNANRPFYIHYALSHIHGKIQPTPDSKPGSKNLYEDNIAYMDKLVGKLIMALDSLNLRDNTLIVFMGDNGTASGFAARSTIGGRQLSGMKGTMKEGGSLVPMIVNWPGVISNGRISDLLIDASDFLPTFAEIAGANLPMNTIIDGQSFASQLTGKKGKSREWIFMELGNKWYVRDARWKLNREGELFDMRNAPFEEKLVADYNRDKESKNAYKRLKEVLDKLNPAGGILDDGDGSGKNSRKKIRKIN